MKDIITDSIRYCESRRIGFNAALSLVLIGSFVYHRHSSVAGLAALTWEQVAFGLLFAAVTANLLYCAAYVADIFVQLSEYRQTWRRRRWMLLGVGTALASAFFLLHE